MKRGLWVFIVCGLVALVSPVRAADDPVRAGLDKAKATYEADLEKHRAAVAAWLDKREEAARKNGDKKAVDQVKAERQAFDEKGDLPKAAPAALKSQLVFARTALEAAYKIAVREYTKAKMDDEATTVEKELESFKRGDLSSAVAGERWMPLFNGKDLTGWKQHPDSTGKWTVEGGAIVGRGIDQSHLFTEGGEYADFHIRVEAKVNATGNSGICFRTNYFGRGRVQGNGYEANIEGDKSRRWQTGSLMHITPKGEIAQQLVKPGEWFVMEVIAVGKQITVKVNDKTAVDLTDPDHTYKRGHLALQQLGDKTEVQFRKVELKALPQRK